MSSPRYFVYPFGEAGDLSAVTTYGTGVNTGIVSYQYGWTPNYQLDLNTDPSALPIPRNQFNQIMFDITNNTQQYWQYGTPFPILSTYFTPNAAWSYAIFARIYYDSGNGDGAQIWENQLANNTFLPTNISDNSWNVVSGSSVGNPTGTIIDFAGINPPVGYLLCDGSTSIRANFPELLSAITFTRSATVNATNVVAVADTSNMFVGMFLEDASSFIPAGTQITVIVPNTSITISNVATGSATEILTFFPWGNGDSSTTFTLPDFRRSVAMGSGGAASTDPFGVGNLVGQQGGQESHVQTELELASHDHPGSVIHLPVNNNDTGNGFVESQGNSAPTATPIFNLAIALQGNGDAFNIIQPVNIVTKCIKT